MKKQFGLLLLLLFISNFLSAQNVTRIACVGNSITYGAGIENRDKDSYPAVLGQMLGNTYDVRNFGVSGRTMLNKGDYPYTNEQAYKDALAFNPNIVIIKLGTNDSKPYNWQYKDEYQQDTEALINSFKALPSKPEVYLCLPAKAYTLKWGINDSIIVNEVIPEVLKVADKCNVKVINLYSPTTNMHENFPDDIHPNEIGAKVLAKEVYNAITR